MSFEKFSKIFNKCWSKENIFISINLFIKSSDEKYIDKFVSLTVVHLKVTNIIFYNYVNINNVHNNYNYIHIYVLGPLKCLNINR